MYILISVFAVYYAAVIFYLRRGLQRTGLIDAQVSKKAFSIIIAAKNESGSIPHLIHSLRRLEYKGEYEIIIVDDNSEDGTFDKCTALIEAAELQDRASVIKAGSKEYPGKKGALNEGIKAARYPYLLITDADCEVPAAWLNYYNGAFEEGYDLVFGPAPFKNSGSLINKLSRFENLRSFMLTSAAALGGIPYSAAARNFGFTAAAFSRVNGYGSTTQVLSGDDDLLIREAVKGGLKTGCITDRGAAVYSETAVSLKEYIRQRSRHTTTSLHYLPRHMLLLAVWHLVNLIMLFSLFVPGWQMLFAVKMTTDIIAAVPLSRRFGYSFTPLEVLYLQPLYELFLIINFAAALLRKDEW